MHLGSFVSTDWCLNPILRLSTVFIHNPPTSLEVNMGVIIPLFGLFLLFLARLFYIRRQKSNATHGTSGPRSSKAACLSDLSIDSHEPTVASEATHTMGGSLFEYLHMKVHPSIQDKAWSRIHVIGEHQRDPTIVQMSPIEKRDKPFNWMRPTISLVDSNTLQLHVFPGLDYVEHYAAIVATYLSLRGGDPTVVQYTLPNKEQCLEPFLVSNLTQMGSVDLVIVGYVDGLERWTQGPWEESDNGDLFSWKTINSKQGYRIAFLGCRICFWGDIGGNLVRTLQNLNGAKCVVYIGKLGSLCPQHVPNHTLATGCQSYVHGDLIRWENRLEAHLQHAPSVVRGIHCSLGSVLNETKDWLASTKKKCDFVDPEIGHMAKASLEGGTQFGYLHIISDNLARKYDRDLSNERRDDVIQGRKRLMVEVQDVLGQFIDQWSPK